MTFVQIKNFRGMEILKELKNYKNYKISSIE